MFCYFSRWFHGKIGRVEAENLLKPKEDGLFLVRESTNFPGDYTLCVCFGQKVEHYHIIYKNDKLTIDEEEHFDNLIELVEVAMTYLCSVNHIFFWLCILRSFLFHCNNCIYRKHPVDTLV